MKALHSILLATLAATSLLVACDKREGGAAPGAGGTTSGSTTSGGTSGSGTTATPPATAASPASR
jgi:hypothetical protein